MLRRLIKRRRNRTDAAATARSEASPGSAASFWTAVSSISAALAALFAGWAGWGTRASALEAARATRAAVWMQMLTEYESQETLSSMKELRQWQLQRSKEFASDFEELILKPAPSDADRKIAESLDADRRRVYGFFEKIRTLDQMGVVTKQEVALSWDMATYRYVAEVLVPMQHAKSEAMFRQGLLSAEQLKQGDADDQRVLSFYRDVANTHQSIIEIPTK